MIFRSSFSLFLFALCLSSLSCAPLKIVSDPGTAYESMGFLEERVAVDGILGKKTYAKLTKSLNEKLEKKARQKYDADAVTHISYWPAPDADALVDYLYARGEMIRYKKFNEDSTVPLTDLPV